MVGQAAWKIRHRLAGYMPYRCLILPAGAGAAAEVAPPEGIMVREIGLDELARYARDPRYELGERFLADLRERGDRCIGALAGGSLVSYGFVSRVPTNIDAGFRFQFPLGWAYQYKAFTLPEWRGKRLHACLGAARRKAAGEPDRGMVTLVATTNLTSVTSLARAGFQPLFEFAISGKGQSRRVSSRGRGELTAEGLLLQAPELGGAFAVTRISGA